MRLQPSRPDRATELVCRCPSKIVCVWMSPKQYDSKLKLHLFFILSFWCLKKKKKVTCEMSRKTYSKAMLQVIWTWVYTELLRSEILMHSEIGRSFLIRWLNRNQLYDCRTRVFHINRKLVNCGSNMNLICFVMPCSWSYSKKNHSSVLRALLLSSIGQLDWNTCRHLSVCKQLFHLFF